MDNEPNLREAEIVGILVSQVQFNMATVRTLLAILEHTKVDDKGAIKAEMNKLLDYSGEVFNEVKELVEQRRNDLKGQKHDS